MKIFVFNWHEPYLDLLARVGFEWIVADWHRPWNTAFRALPENARRCSDDAEGRSLIADRRVDLVLCQTEADLDWVGDARIPLVFLAHNSLPNEVRLLPDGSEARLRTRVRDALARTRGAFVAISEMKRDSWGVDGDVILPGIRVEDFDGYTGGVEAGLTVGNLLRERGHMMGFAQLEAALTNLPWHVVGTNPALGTAEAETWTALRAAYRAHRFYAHATQWPWEDGYNLALLEAMATGMPTVAWANPTSPVLEGITGFVAEDPGMFALWATRLLEDHDLARKLGAAARQRVAAQFPFDAFSERWAAVLARAANATRQAPSSHHPTSSPAPVVRRGPRPRARRRILLATSWTPISTSMYYTRAFRRDHDVLTCGPSMSEATLSEWKTITEQHALKTTGSAEEKIEMLRGLSRPADLPCPPGRPSAPSLLDRLPHGWRPDLFVWLDGGPGFLPLDVDRLDCPTVCLIGNSHTQLDWRVEYARHFSHVFLMFNRQHVPLFREKGCRNVEWLPAACDPDIHRRFDVEAAFDIVFVGQTLKQWHADSGRLLERLRANGFHVHVTTRILEEMALAFARGRIVFNRSLAGDLSMQVFEALATGRMLLTDRLTPESGAEELFRDRVHLVYYGEDDLESLARYYLEHPDERAAIADAGHREVLRRHTYRHRAATLLQTVLGDEPETDVPCPTSGKARARTVAGIATGGDDDADLAAYYRNERPEVARLVPSDARRVLDVGCAAGGLGRSLKARGHTVVGIEANRKAAAAARKHLDEVLELDLDTIDDLPFEESFDCIVCADVLEHLRDPDRVLAILARHLAPHGVLIASVPNVRHLGVVLPLLVDGRWEYRDEGILDRTHLRFFTLAEIADLFTRNGFRVRSAGATKTTEHPAIAVLAEAVRTLGGDEARFAEETCVVQYLVVAEPARIDAANPPSEDSADGAEPAVSIVVPVHDGAAFTVRCLEALAKTVPRGEAEVIVVDNASSDETSRLLAAPPLPVRVLRNAANEGFARASNQGAHAARGQLLVFLNNDTEPEARWLEALRTTASEPGVGIVGARLLYPGTRRIQHAGLALNADGVPDHVWRCAEADDPRVVEARDVDMVTGACLAIRRDLFLALGGFDEGYRNGVEDVDLCLAARAAGFGVRYEPQAVVLHHEGATAGRFDNVAPNLERFREKWSTTLATMDRRPAEDFGRQPGPLVAFEGSFFLHHSLARVNRAVCTQLLTRGVDLVLDPFEPDEFDPARSPDTARLATLIRRPTRTPPVLRIRHRYPPDFSRRKGERLVIMQPWEFGAVPADWVRGINENVDELWVPSEFVRTSFVSGGVPGDRVYVIPHAFDPAVFHPGASPLPLPTRKRFRFLYVGGSIPRKGYDVLLRAYFAEFTAADDVCLVVKDHAYYRSNLDELLAPARSNPGAPEIAYYFEHVLPEQMAAFYTAADCLVHPFRGEGFGLPILEAMACGRAVIVTDAGPVRDFCPDDAAIFIRAQTIRFPEPRIDTLETIGVPTLAEPDVDELRRAMRYMYEHPADCRRRGQRAAEHVHARFTWAKVAPAYIERLQALLEQNRPEVGLALLAEGRVADALPIFADVIRHDPANLAALVGAAHCALALDETAGARALLHRVLELDPSHAGARAALGVLDEPAEVAP